MNQFPVKLVGAAITVLLLFVLFLATYFTVDQNERGVVSSWGEYNYTAEPGLHFKVPFRDSVTFYRNDVRSYAPDKAANTYTIDNQEVDIIFTIFYRITPEKAQYVFENARDFSPLLYRMAEDRLKAEMGRVSVAHVAEKRGEIRDKIKATMLKDAKVLGVEVTDFQLTNITYSNEFRKAVEGAAIARQGVITRENEKDQAEKVALTAKIKAEGEANAAREAAKGKADAIFAVAQAEAKSIKLKGEAEAAATKAQGEALAQNQKLVELRKAERWDGKLPVQMLSGVVPFMQFNQPDTK